MRECLGAQIKLRITSVNSTKKLVDDMQVEST